MMLPTSNLNDGAFNPAFWQMLDELIASSKIVIDRPKASRHPRYPHIVYPLDYGYLDNTSSMDGEGIDLWQGSCPERKLTAIFVTVDMMKRDCEIKLMLGCTEEEIDLVDHFFNDYAAMKALLIRREE